MSASENGTIGRDPVATVVNDLPTFEIEQFIDDRRDATKFHAHYRDLLLKTQSVVSTSHFGTPESRSSR